MIKQPGVEMVFIGYNTPIHYPPVPEHDHLQGFHNHLMLQVGAYQNGMWIVGIAKAGKEEDCDLLGQSCIIAPTGEIDATWRIVCETRGSAQFDSYAAAMSVLNLLVSTLAGRPEIHAGNRLRVAERVHEGLAELK